MGLQEECKRGGFAPRCASTDAVHGASCSGTCSSAGGTRAPACAGRDVPANRLRSVGTRPRGEGRESEDRSPGTPPSIPDSGWCCPSRSDPSSLSKSSSACAVSLQHGSRRRASAATGLFRTFGRDGELTANPMDRTDVLRMVKRRARAAGLPETTCCHTFRATGIRAYFENGGTLEKAQQNRRAPITAHDEALRPNQ